MIGKFIYAWCTSDAGVSGVVSTRVYPAVAPQGAAFPRITYTVIDDTSDKTLQGRSGCVLAVVQVDAWAKDYATVDTLATHLHDLDGYSGTLGGVRVQWSWCRAKSYATEPPADSSDTPTYRISQTYHITYEE